MGKTYLGTLCNRGHDHEGTGMSLRGRKGRGNCVACKKIYQVAYRLINREKMKKYGKEWHAKNKEKNNAISKKYYLDNKERMDEWQRKYYLENKEKIALWHKKYQQNNPEGFKRRNRKYRSKHKEKAREQDRSYVKNLCPGYLRGKIKEQMGLPTSEISQEQIAIKRELLKSKRLLKKLREENSNELIRESDCNEERNRAVRL